MIEIFKLLLIIVIIILLFFIILIFCFNFDQQIQTQKPQKNPNNIDINRKVISKRIKVDQKHHRFYF